MLGPGRWDDADAALGGLFYCLARGDMEGFRAAAKQLVTVEDSEFDRDPDLTPWPTHARLTLSWAEVSIDNALEDEELEVTYGVRRLGQALSFAGTFPGLAEALTVGASVRSLPRF